jgi:hypothetical protein
MSERGSSTGSGRQDQRIDQRERGGAGADRKGERDDGGRRDDLVAPAQADPESGVTQD